MNSYKNKGFTLIELVVVIGIIAVLVSIVLVALNPSKQFKQANNTKRGSDVTAILNAVQHYAASNRGVYPAGITTSAQTIEKNGGIDICSLLVPTFIAALPVDPLTNNGTTITNCGSAYNTNYTILKGATNSRITVSAPGAELGATINVTQ